MAGAYFDQERASSYDRQRAKLAPMHDALHLLIRMVFSELPADARILCVGVGTGTELMDLAQAFPRWRFTAVEPAAPMLDICRRRAEESRIGSRCTFHEGYLDSLPESDSFDAATCLLVSHFVPTEGRRDFFRGIAARLRPDGVLVNSDLASDMSASTYESPFEVWLRTLKYSDFPAEEIEGFALLMAGNPRHSRHRKLNQSLLRAALTHPYCSSRLFSFMPGIPSALPESQITDGRRTHPSHRIPCPSRTRTASATSSDG